MENYRNEEAGQSSLVLAKAPTVIENHQDYHGRKLWTYLTRIKQLRAMWDLILWIVCQNSLALKNISSLNWLPYYLKTRIFKPVGITRAKCSGFYFAIDYVTLCFQNNAKHKKASQVSIVQFHDDRICTCCSMSFNEVW